MADSRKEWPNLVGKSGEEAKAAIQQEDSSLEVIILPENSPVTRDFRLDRVRIFVKEDGTVATTPMTG